MTSYSVNWKIDIEAESPVEAAKQALEIHRDQNSTAIVFDVFDEHRNYTRVDLLEIEEEQMSHIAGGWPDLIEPYRHPNAPTAKIPHWEDDPDFPSGDWKYEVANGDTRLGYHQWVKHQRDDKKEKPRWTPN
ncbi:MAG: hypothetical protein ABSH41_31640 [Syntrophobacteraceae bacterium]|jgi:hypothetical protein